MAGLNLFRAPPAAGFKSHTSQQQKQLHRVRLCLLSERLYTYAMTAQQCGYDDEETRLEMYRLIADAINYLHTLHIVHVSVCIACTYGHE